MARLAQNLRDAVKKLAYSTSVDQLKKRGVNKVNVLGVDRIALLIQESVKKSLHHKLLSLDREEVASATKEEFLRLLRSNESLERQHDELTRLKEQAEAQVDELRRELVQQKSLLEQKLDQAESQERARYEGEDRDIARRLRGLVKDLAAAGKSEELPERVLEFAMSVIREGRRDTMQAEEAVRDREVANLRRRIEKLTANLQDTEHRLAEVSTVRHIDEGISSIYREVQGLETTDKAFETKNVLMTSIFEANLRLQGK